MSDYGKASIAIYLFGLFCGAGAVTAVELVRHRQAAKSAPVPKPDIRAYEDTLRGIVCYSATGHPTLSCVRHP